MAEDKKSRGKPVVDAIIGQTITEFTRPMIAKLPPELLRSMKAIGVDKIMPVVGVALASFFSPDRFPLVGDKLGDAVNEITSELRRAMNDAGGEGETRPEKGESKKTPSAGFVNALFDLRLGDQVQVLLTSLTELFEGRDEKEREQIIALLNSMSKEQLLAFLTQQKDIREKYITLFVKRAATKTEKTLEEAIKELQANISKLKPALDYLKNKAVSADAAIEKTADIAMTALSNRTVALNNRRWWQL